MRRSLFASASLQAVSAFGLVLMASLIGTEAMAQAEPLDTSLEEVVVTGSRVQRDGTRAPTPVTVIGAEQLQASSPVTVADSLNQLPSFGNSTAANRSGAIATTGNFLNMRSLGANRNLVLLNGRRVIPSTNTGTVNIDLFPQSIIQRVDVVTGGASAAYGSDAVSGVINFILDTKFTGLKGEVQAGTTKYHDNENFKISLAAGGGFHDGRGHVVASVEFAKAEGIANPTLGFTAPRKWNANGDAIVPNPVAGATPALIRIQNSRQCNLPPQGVVVTGPLRGQTFNSDGTLRSTPMNFGVGCSPTAGVASGGEGWNGSPIITLAAPYERNLLFVSTTYDITPNVTAFSEITYAQHHGSTLLNPPFTSLFAPTGAPIAVDNAYLPAALRSQMQSLGLSQVGIGQVIGQGRVWTGENTTSTTRFVAGLEGKIADDRFRWNAYYQYGKVNQTQTNHGILNMANFQRSIDAVRNAAGTIVCRSTLTNPNDGCVPTNLLGGAKFTDAQNRYLYGDPTYPGVLDQQVAEASISGDLFNLPAGMVSGALGVGYRKDTYERTADPVTLSVNPYNLTTGGYFQGNNQPYAGQASNKEIFGEVAIPLLKDLPLVSALDINAAGRYTDYSTSGGTKTWKIGATYEMVEGLRFRAARSRDVRAPSLDELYLGPTTGYSIVRDPFLGNISYNAVPITSGNAALRPEVGKTTTYGITYNAPWLPGFAASIDAYKINISSAIASPGLQLTIDQCFAGNQSLCGTINRGPSGQIITIALKTANLASLRTEGEDIEVSYRTSLEGKVPMLTGTLQTRLLVNHVRNLITSVPGSAPVNRAGDVGQNLNGLPRWRSFLTIDYTQGQWGVQIQESYVGGGRYDSTTEVRRGGSDKDVSPMWTTNLSGRYRFADNRYEAYVSINNLMDRSPPSMPAVLGRAGMPTNPSLYEVIGRSYVAGLRFKF